MNPVLPLLLALLLPCSLFALADSSDQDVKISLPSGLCADELKQVNQTGSPDHMDLMHLAVCMHKHSHPATIDLYQHIRRTTPDYNYVLVNIGVLAGESTRTN